MTMLSPLGRVPRQRPAASRRPHRPLPALILLAALFVLAAIVWWRVLHRGPEQSAAATECRPTPTLAALALDPRTVKVRVYNASDKAGLARGVADALRKRGFSIAATSNDPLSGVHPVEGVGELRYGRSGSGQALLVSLQFPGIKLLQDPRTDAIVDVALGPKFASVATPTQVNQAKQKAQAQARGKPATAAC